MAKIGIDFGTSYTTVSYRLPGTGQATPIRINGKEKIPSVMYFPGNGELPLFGEAAFNVYKDCLKIKDAEKSNRYLSGIFSDLKRNMNPDERLYLPDGQDLSYAEMLSQFFQYIKQEVETTIFQGDCITDVCITYPIEFEQFKKDILQEAATKAGFKKVKLLKEPVAAAMGYQCTQQVGRGNSCKNTSVLVYDFGGGTFDLAFVKFDMNGDHITLPPMGDGHCGGEDIDLLLYQEWDKLTMAESGIHISKLEGTINYPFLKAVCMQNKVDLSEYFKETGRKKKELNEDVADDFRCLTMTKQKWEDLISPVIERTIELTRQMLDVIKRENFTVDKVILIGGSSRISLIYDRLSEILPIPPSRVEDLDVAVANGAALYINQDSPVAKKCFCRMDGQALTTKEKFCRFCGTPNFRYDLRFDDYHG